MEPEVGGGAEAVVDSTPDWSSMSDDEVMGYEAPASDTDGAPNAEPTEPSAPAEATPVVDAEGKEAAPPTEAKPAEGTQPTETQEDDWLDASAVPDQFNPIFKKHPPLKEAFYTARDYGKLFPGGRAEARTLRGLFPTNGDAEEAASIAAAAVEFRGSMRSPDDFVRYVAGSEPQVLDKLTAGFADAVGKMAPQSYRKLAEPVWRNTLDSMERQARQSGDEDALEFITAARGYFGLNRPDQAPSDDPRIREWENWKRGQGDQATKDAEAKHQDFQRFGNDVDREYRTGLTAQVTAEIEKLDGSFTAAAKQEMVEKVLKSVNQQLGSNKFLTSQLTTRFHDGKRDADHQKETVAFLLDRARLLASQETRKTVTYYSREVFARDQKDTSRRQKSAERRDPGAPNPGATVTSAAPSASKRVDYRKTSDDDVFAGRIKHRE